MARTAKMPKSEIVSRLGYVFQENGYEGASLAALADAAALSKASLYHYFPKGKEQMAAAVLARAGSALQTHIFGPLAVSRSGMSTNEEVRSGLLASLDGVAVYYSGEIPKCLMNGLTMGSGMVLFGEAIAATVLAWRDAYTACYEKLCDDQLEASAWGQYAVERIQGALILCRVEGGRGPLLRCIEELKGDVSMV